MPITVLNKSNVPTGPFTRTQVEEKLRTGQFSMDDLAHVEGLGQWTPLRNVLAMVDLAPSSPAQPTPLAAPAPVPAYSYAATMLPPEHLVYAGFWVRVGAHLLDNLIISALSLPLVMIWLAAALMIIGAGAFTTVMQLRTESANPALIASFAGTIFGFYFTLVLTLILGRLIIAWLYHAFLESGPHQSTWGKRALGLKVTSMTGQRITFSHASGRFFAIFITNMTMGIGYLMVAFTDQKQTLHDMIASTLVVKQ